MKRLHALVSLCLVSLCLLGCAQAPAGGLPYVSFTSQRDLRKIGDTLASQELKSYGVYRPTSAATVYVDTLCNKVYAATEAAAEPVQCNVLDTNLFNADATPGYLSVYRGILPFLNSEDELAAILGHESGHLTARHTAKSISTDILTNLALQTAALAAGSGGNVAAIQTTQQVGQAATVVGQGVYSRGHEAEADALGRRYMALAGYPKTGSVGVARVMLMYGQYEDKRSQLAFGAEQQGLLAKLKSSHPASEDRVEAALKEAGEPAAVPPEQDELRKRYMQAMEGLVWGPPRRDGIARAHELVLTRQRMVIPLPQGMTTDYVPSDNDVKTLGTWLLGHPRSGVYLRLTAVTAPTGFSPASLVANNLPLLHGEVQRIRIGQNTPATAPVTATEDDADETDPEDLGTTAPNEETGFTATYHFLNSSKQFRRVAFAAPTRKDTMIVLTVIYPDEETFNHEDGNIMAILQNVRFLTKTQALAYKPLYLHTFTAAEGDTVAREAAKLPVGSLQEDLFRTLNALPEGQEMTIGQLYKTIIDPNP